MDLKIQKLVETLRDKKLKIGFSESCTGGLLSSQLTALAGVSDIYMGSFITYSYESKSDLLGVSSELLAQQGAVCEEVAIQMVRGTCLKLKVDCAISITGIAGPTGGSSDKPVGTVWFAVKGPNFEVAEKRLFSGKRQEIQSQAADFAVELFLSKMTKA